ncbi:MAG: hypothetical protein KFW07_00015, partial [Mycoplasmataceae bacterium]|nr:hypothetical protein [Mycoplasmataceae bacterium]
RDNKNRKIKIYRFIDDIFILHSRKISEDIIDIIDAKLRFLNMSINREKMILNEFKKENLNWDLLKRRIDIKYITSVFNKIRKFSKIKEENFNLSKGLVYQENFIKNFKEIIIDIKQNSEKIKNFKAFEMNFLLKEFLIMKNKSQSFSDKKIKLIFGKIILEIKNFVTDIWELILNKFSKNPAILNTFAPLIYIINYDKRKRAIHLLNRIKSKDWDKIAEYCFPFISYLICCDIKYLDLIKKIFGLECDEATIIASENDIIKRVNSSFIY